MDTSNKRFALFCLVLAIIYVVGIFLFSWFIYPHQSFPSSPDERAAQTFTDRLAQRESFVISEDKSIPDSVRPFIVPRSTVFVPGEGIRYASYLGLPTLFSLFGSVFSYNFIFSLFALVGVISVYGICKNMTNNRHLSLAGAIIYATLPHILLYSARGFMHNALFVDIFACALWLLCIGISKKWPAMLISSGAFLALAAAVRSNEMLWAAPLYVAVICFIARKKFFKPLVVTALSAIVMFAPFTLISYTLTHSPVQYQALSSEAVGQSESIIRYTASLFFPFGFDLSDSFTTFWHFASHIWWVIGALVLSVTFTIWHALWKKKIARAIFIGVLVLLGVYSIAFYGLFAQEGPKNIVLVSHSHFRYWLPIFAASAIAIPFVISLIKREKIQLWLARVVTLGFIVGSISFLWFGKGGVQDNPYQNNLAYERNKKMHETIPTDAIILAGIADKYFFPDWEVAGTGMHGDRRNFVDKLKNSKMTRPVYYYFTPSDVSSHRTLKAIQDSGIKTEYVTTFFENETLYQLLW